MKNLGKLLKYLARVAKYGTKIAKRMAQLEKAITRLRASVAAAKRLFARYGAELRTLEDGSEEWNKVMEKLRRITNREAETQAELTDLQTRLRRLLQGLSETLPAISGNP